MFAVPFDLRLPEGNQKDEETTFVVQPDLLVIYLAGKRAFWQTRSYTEESKVRVTVFPELVVDLGLVFEGM